MLVSGLLNTKRSHDLFMSKNRILFVDDELPVLQGIERVLHSRRDHWECEFVDGARTALLRLQEAPFDVVVADLQMPGLDGTTFLQAVFELYPDTVRLMLTGHADLASAVEVINRGHVFQLLLKPCEGGRLIRALESAVRQHHLQTAERELLRAQLEHAQKLGTIGLMAAGIAHDLNNILGVIVLQSHPDMHTAGDSWLSRVGVLGQINEAATSAAELTRELGMLSRWEDEAAEPRALDLRGVMESCARTLRPALGKPISLELVLPAEPLPVMGHEGKLNQVLINLVFNARDAMPAGGKLWLEARHVQWTGAEAASRRGRRAGSHICLEVRDTGQGMDEATCARIFDPFFTTKESGRGTGLGLSMVRSLVERHQGWIEVDSALGVGTTFRIYLPVRHV